MILNQIYINKSRATHSKLLEIKGDKVLIVGYDFIKWLDLQEFKNKWQLKKSA